MLRFSEFRKPWNSTLYTTFQNIGVACRKAGNLFLLLCGLFRHLPRPRNAHIHQVCSAFEDIEQLQNSSMYRNFRNITERLSCWVTSFLHLNYNFSVDIGVACRVAGNLFYVMRFGVFEEFIYLCEWSVVNLGGLYIYIIWDRSV